VQPSLTNSVQGDLAVVADFRDVYASMLEDVIGTEAGKNLPNRSTKLSSPRFRSDVTARP